jgi:hypothetical protein
MMKRVLQQMEANIYNQRQLDMKQVAGSHLTKLTRLYQGENHLKVDGYCGPQTLKHLTGVHEDTGETKQIWEVFDGPLDHLPRNRRDVYKIFGDPSNGSKVDKHWYKQNIRTYRKAMALPGVDPNRYVKLHRLAEPYVREALLRTQSVSDYKITRFGDFNYRLMKAANRLSYHAFGIAFDINPEDNKAIRYRHSRDKPEPFSDEWWGVYPKGMPKSFVDAIKSVGFGWGGDWSTFSDAMHFELVLP